MACCEMCGKNTTLLVASIEGTELKVCPNCVKHGVIKQQKSFSQSFNVKPQFKPGELVTPRIGKSDYKVMDDLSKKLRNAREASGLSQEDFSKQINERESLFSKWELGVLIPSVDTARKVGKILGIQLVEEDKEIPIEVGLSVNKDEFTLGDFIKVRKRK